MMRSMVCVFTVVEFCGSEIVADETTGATTCPFCNNKITMKGQFAGDLEAGLYYSV